MKQLSTPFIISGACGLFILLGIAFIPYTGIQHDEALFSVPLYLFNAKELSISVFHHRLPLMVMSYVGTLKTLIYLPIFSVFRPTAWTIRLPMVLTGALTVLFFYKLASVSVGRPAAILGAFLLATDPIFLLTDTFDWGPVALEHFLLVTGCFCVVRFAQKNLMRDLAFGFFCLGLGLWNKAIFLWALSGLFCGVAIFWPEIRRVIRPRSAGLAVASFLIGALPFVLYNVRRPNDTLRSSAHLDTAHLAGKLRMVAVTLDGSGLFGFIPAPDSADNVKPVSTMHGRFAWWIRNRLGDHYRSGLEIAFLLSLLAFPWWWRSRAARFSLVFITVAWLAMAVTKDAGGSLHHTVLLMPFPQLFVVATLFQLRWRKVAIAAGALLVVFNLLVVNQYILSLETNGAWNSFTDALYPLSGRLRDVKNPIYVVDWGMLDALALLHQGHLTLRAGDALFADENPAPGEQHDIPIVFAISDALYIGHVSVREVNRGSGERLIRAAAALGYQKRILDTIPDSNGRPVFELFKVVRATLPAN